MYYFELKSVSEPITLYETTSERVFDFILWMLKDRLPNQFSAGKGKDVFQFQYIHPPKDNCITVKTIWARERDGRVYYPTGRDSLDVWKFVVSPLQRDDILLDVRALADLRDDSMYGERSELLEDTDEIIEMFTEYGAEFFVDISRNFSHSEMDRFLSEAVDHLKHDENHTMLTKPLQAEQENIELQIKDKFASLWTKRGWIRMKGYSMNQWLLDNDAPPWLSPKALQRHIHNKKKR